MKGERIQSHHDPKRYLKQHIAEIIAASEAVLLQHGEAHFRILGTDDIAKQLARLHDLGKGSAAFQRYIANPAGYQGKPKEKSHTLLSLVLAAHHTDLEDPARFLALALAVRGHHGGQPSEGEALLDPLKDDEWRDLLCFQIPSVDMAALAEETGLTLAPVDDPIKAIRGVWRKLRDALNQFRALSREQMVLGRFLARAAYSVLLEADKAFLAVDREQIRKYLHRAHLDLRATEVDTFCTRLEPTPMNTLRERARDATMAGFARCKDEAILTLTLPTGAGKTLLAARWALAERAGSEGAIDTPMIILALPMLSIVDQTERVWRELLGVADNDGETLLPFHSLSERAYDPELSQGTADFFIDTWRSEVVVTTFDQILLALFDDRAKHAMRYHRLLNARIVIDEIQNVPPILWKALSEALSTLTRLGRTRVLSMSATPSPCLEGATEVLSDPDALYEALGRYELRLEHSVALEFEEFAERAITLCREAVSRGEGTLVTLNVRATAQETFTRLESAGLAPLLISGDMTPWHRLRVIDQIKRDPCRVVVSTQCVEAGVDLDMHHVIRDFAPLDALVQIAGRCNRHGHRRMAGTVTVYHLRSLKGRDDAALIYDEILLDCTREALRGKRIVYEREVLSLCRDWYRRVSMRKYQGDHDFTRWARLEGALDIRKLLRGEDDEKRQVLVVEQDPSLKGDLNAALGETDRWVRRSKLRALSARLARHTVSVSSKVFDTLEVLAIDHLGAFQELMPGYYHPICGIDGKARP